MTDHPAVTRPKMSRVEAFFIVVWLTALIVRAIMTTSASLGLQGFFEGRVELLECQRRNNPVNLETAVSRASPNFQWSADLRPGAMRRHCGIARTGGQRSGRRFRLCG